MSLVIWLMADGRVPLSALLPSESELSLYRHHTTRFKHDSELEQYNHDHPCRETLLPPCHVREGYDRQSGRDSTTDLITAERQEAAPSHASPHAQKLFEM